MKRIIPIFVLFISTFFIDAGMTSTARAEECEHDWYESSCQAATLSRDGVVTYECLNCEATKTEPIARPQTFKLAKKSYTYNNNWKEPAVKVWDSEGNRISSEYSAMHWRGDHNRQQARPDSTDRQAAESTEFSAS